MLKPSLSLLLQDLKDTLAQELDFENEARNAERCAHDLEHFCFVVIPRVHREQSSKVCLGGGAGAGVQNASALG